MSTWKYGPIVVNDDSGGYVPAEDDSYEVHYQTTADVLSVVRNGKWETGWQYFGSRAVAKMISEWYLTYVCGHDCDVVKDLLKNERS